MSDANIYVQNLSRIILRELEAAEKYRNQSAEFDFRQNEDDYEKALYASITEIEISNATISSDGYNPKAVLEVPLELSEEKAFYEKFSDCNLLGFIRRIAVKVCICINIPEGLVEKSELYIKNSMGASETVGFNFSERPKFCDLLKNAIERYLEEIDKKAQIDDFSKKVLCSETAREKYSAKADFHDGVFYYFCPSKIEIPENISIINPYAFKNWTNLEEAVFYDNVEKIGDGAFCGCHLKTIRWPRNLKSIGDGAFYNCDFTNVRGIPATVTYLGNGAFNSNDRLVEAEVPVGISEVNALFVDCRNLKQVYMFDNLKTIGYQMFKNCISLESVYIPDSVTKIGREAFRNCQSLKSITLPKALREIGEYAFKDCDCIRSFEIPPKVKKIGFAAFPEWEDITLTLYAYGKIPYTITMYSSIKHRPSGNITLFESDRLYEFFNKPCLENFMKIERLEHKIEIALAYGRCKHKETDLYIEFLKNNAVEMVRYIIQNKKASAYEYYAKQGLISGELCKEFVFVMVR